MKVNFVGDDDVQRSLNLSDNRCVNLYPTTNNHGEITAFINTPGLLLYKDITNSSIASGIYTASNGRCFMAAGSTLYEVTTGAVLTDRGTITTPLSGNVTRFSDNGIDLIFVNGTDGWTYTFSTDELRQIKVLSGTVTVTIASPAVFSYVAHGLVLGDRFMLATTGGLPTGLKDLTVYWVISAGLTANAFEASKTSGGAAINTTGTQSGVHTLTSIGYGFPNGAKTISYMNGRHIALEPGTQNFNVSEPLDAQTWDVLNVQTVDSNPDLIVGEAVSHNELIVFCALSGEAFYDEGTLPSPFVRNISGIFEVGCEAPYSIAKLDNTIYWLGNSVAGKGVIYKLQGYTPVRISTYGIEFAIQEMSDITDAISFAYQQDGHHFYVITFPTGSKSYCYDINTGLWHERANFIKGAFIRWEAQEYAYFDGKHLVCDYSEGNVYSIDLDTYKYGSEDRKWLRSFRVPTTNMNRIRHSKLQLDCEAGRGLIDGTDPEAMLRFSDDGGHTWSTEKWRSMGKIGEYAMRVYWKPLGSTSGQPRIYEISGTTPTKTVLLNVHLD